MSNLDWFDNENENIFIEGGNVNIISLSENDNAGLGDLEMDIDNIFMEKRNQLEDLDIKIDDFVLGTNSNNIKLNQTSQNEVNNNMNFSNDKIFQIKKENKKSIKLKDKKEVEEKEELSDNLFYASNNKFHNKNEVWESKDNFNNNAGNEINVSEEIEDKNERNNDGLSLHTNLDSSTENTHLNNFNVEENVRKQSNFFFNNHVCNGRGSVPCPFNNYISIQNLSVAERMKLKKEKAKWLLLERKTKRENFEFEKTILEKAESLCVPCEVSPSQHSNTLNSLNSSNTNSTGLNSKPSFLQDVNKKEIKMLRNRISAQRSRDRKKKEYDDLKLISQNLLNENSYLKKELDSKDKEIADLKEKLRRLCKNCRSMKGIFEKPRISSDNSEVFSSSEETVNNTQSSNNYSLVDISRRNFTSSLKYSIMTGLLVIVCLIGVYVTEGNEKINQQEGRILESKQSSPQTSKGVIIYSSDADSSDSTTSSTEASSPLMINSHAIPATPSTKSSIFSISKEIDKYIKIYKNKIVNKENSFLMRKRKEFITKMNKRNNEKKEIGFLFENKPSLCVDIEGMDVRVQKEVDLDLHEDDKEDQRSHPYPEIVQTLPAITDGSQFNQNDNYLIPFTNLNKNSYIHDHTTLLKDKIKSMYCKDFITSTEENENMFKNLFNKLNTSHHIGDDETNKKEDCLYLHMVVPSTNKIEKANIKVNIREKIEKMDNVNFMIQNSEHLIRGSDEFQEAVESGQDDKEVYYEVGCKIFEINKIYK